MAAAAPYILICRTRTAFRDLNPHYDEFFEVGNLPAAAGQQPCQDQDQGRDTAGAGNQGASEAWDTGAQSAANGAGAAGARGGEAAGTAAGAVEAEAAGGAGQQGARLGVEVWDKDLLTANDIIGAAEWEFAPQRVSVHLLWTLPSAESHACMHMKRLASSCQAPARLRNCLHRLQELAPSH